MQTIPPCGIGGPSTPSGPCTGTYSPSDAGSGVFNGIGDLAVSATHALLAAGVIIAGLLFAIWAVRKVAKFFGGDKPAKGLYEQDSAFWAAAGAADLASRNKDADAADNMRDAWGSEFDHEAYGRAYNDRDGETEDDTEDDRPYDLEHEEHQRVGRD